VKEMLNCLQSENVSRCCDIFSYHAEGCPAWDNLPEKAFSLYPNLEVLVFSIMAAIVIGIIIYTIYDTIRGGQNE